MNNDTKVYSLEEYIMKNLGFDSDNVWNSMINEAVDNYKNLEYSHGYVYATRNLVNGKLYIGKRVYKGIDRRYYGSGTILRRALKKYGEDNFETVVLEYSTCDEELCNVEKRWISKYDAVDSEYFYNLRDGGDGFSSGSHNPRHRSKVDIRGENNPMYGKKHSEESKELSRKHNVGRKRTKEDIEKQKRTRKLNGYVATDEHRRNLSRSLKGHIISDETKRKIGESNKKVYESYSEDKKKELAIKKSEWQNDKERRKIANDKLSKNDNITRKVIRVEDMRVFTSLAEADRSLKIGNVNMAVRKPSKYAGGYHWVLLNEYEGLTKEEILQKISKDVQKREKVVSKVRHDSALKANKKLCKKIICVDSGVVYDSVTSAARENNVGISTIINSIRFGTKAKGKTYDYYKTEKEVKENASVSDKS